MGVRGTLGARSCEGSNHCPPPRVCCGARVPGAVRHNHSACPRLCGERPWIRRPAPGGLGPGPCARCWQTRPAACPGPQPRPPQLLPSPRQRRHNGPQTQPGPAWPAASRSVPLPARLFTSPHKQGQKYGTPPSNTQKSTEKRVIARHPASTSPSRCPGSVLVLRPQAEGQVRQESFALEKWQLDGNGRLLSLSCHNFRPPSSQNHRIIMVGEDL